MRTDSLIALKIGQDGRATPLAALRPVLDRALAVIADALPEVESESQRAELSTRLNSYREALVGESHPDQLAALTESCFDLCEQALQALQSQQQERRSELRNLVTLVRETVTLLIDDGDTLSSDISQAATRFHSLLRISDVTQLKQRLAAEVGDLQRLAVDRKQHWSQSAKRFEARIVGLEKQLIAVKHEAALDPLTGISNRRHFEQTIREELQSSQRQLIVAMLDLDDFKLVNDTGGHAAGDSVLQAVAQTLKSSVRRNDLVARIGGDEFALLYRGVTLRDVEPRIRSIVGNLASLATGLERPSHVSVSCGLAEYCAGDTLESVTRRADQALYEAKRHGKNRVVVKSPPFIRDLLHKR